MAKRSNIMLCYPFEEKRLLTYEKPLIFQPKLDGVRCRAVPYPAGYELFSSTMHVITSVPHINAALNRIPREHQVEFDGELYRHGWTFEQINSIVSRTVNIHSDYLDIQLHVFDLVPDDNTPMFGRIVILARYSDWLVGPLARVKNDYGYTSNDVLEMLEHYKKQDYEGIIIRNPGGFYERKRYTGIMKFKPRKMDQYKVIGYIEEHDKYGKPKGRLGALVCVSDYYFGPVVVHEFDYGKKLPDGLFKVGSGLNDYQRKTIWMDRGKLDGTFLNVAYQHITPGKGVPRFPVFMELC